MQTLTLVHSGYENSGSLLAALNVFWHSFFYNYLFFDAFVKVWLDLRTLKKRWQLSLWSCWLESSTLCYSIDGSNSTRLGRFVNDLPRRLANCYTKVVPMNGRPHVLIFAGKDITVGEELRYDYGGGDMPWRKVIYLMRLFITLV